MDTEPKNPVPRRTVLRGAVSSAGFALLPRFVKESETPPEWQRLAEVGLADYWEVWQEGKRTETEIGVQPLIFGDIYDTLNKIANGEVVEDAHGLAT